MTKKEIFIGFAVGIIINVFGTIGYILMFSKLSIETTLAVAYEERFLGSILALGAVPNLLAFFLFLKIKRDLRARGVLFACILTALYMLIEKFL